MKVYDVGIIGGGPSGVMAAISAGQRNKKVVLLERNNSLGKKLLLTGKGRCNFTTSKEIPWIVNAFGKKGKFLYSALTKFSNQDLISFFESRGVRTKVERDQRVFPQSDKSRTILNCLLAELKKNKVRTIYNFRVVKIKKETNWFALLSEEGETIGATKVVLATGGKSYPQTGSTGDGYRLAKDLGHQIIPLKPALASLIIKDKGIRSLAGLSLKNVRLTFRAETKVLVSLFGEMLFTHQGISGPIVLQSSKTVYESLAKKERVVAFLDLKPALDRRQLRKRIHREIHKIPKKEFQSLLKNLLPRSLVYFTCQAVGVNKKLPNASLTSQEVDRLLDFFKGFPFSVDAVAPLSTAIITSGGVDVVQIDSRNMESKIIPNLYFSGEVIALDGPTGGYNLQKAFSTGWSAGLSI